MPKRLLLDIAQLLTLFRLVSAGCAAAAAAAATAATSGDYASVASAASAVSTACQRASQGGHFAFKNSTVSALTGMIAIGYRTPHVCVLGDNLVDI